MINNNKKLLILSMFVFIFILICLPLYYTYAEDTKIIEGYELNAVLYDTSEYSSGTGTVLTTDGAIVSDWLYDTSKYLQIDPRVPADGNTYKIIVELPQEFYVVTNELLIPSGYASVDFKKNPSISVNNNKEYTLKEFSGTIEYTMSRLQTSGTIQLEIRYDFILWDKFKNSNLTPDGVSPIKVRLEKVDSNTSEVNEIKELSLSSATSSSKLSLSTYNYIDTSSGTTSTSFIAKISDSLIQRIGLRSETAIASYYKKMVLEFYFPSYTDSSGNIYYLSVDESTLKLSSGVSSDAVISIEKNKMTISIPNVYYSTESFQVVSFRYINAEELLNGVEGTYFAFKAGTASIYVDSKNGSTNSLLISFSTPSVSFDKSLVEKVVSSSTNKSVSLTERPSNAVSQIGGLYLENKGTGDSGSKNILWEFDIENTGLIRVATMNLLADNVQEYIDVSYTLVDEKNEPVYFNESGERVSADAEGAINTFALSLKNSYYNSKTISNLNVRLKRTNLPENHRDYYFKTVSYTIKTIRAGAKLYAVSSQSTIAAAGNIYAYIDDRAVNGNKVYSKMTVVSEEGSYANITKQITTTLTSNSNVAYLIKSASMSKATIQAGESIDLKASLQVISYPYGNSTWLKGITVGLLLPKGVSVNAQSITAKYYNKKSIDGIVVDTPVDVGEGNYLWKINLPNDVYIGYPNENLYGFTYTSSLNYELINFTIQLDTDYTMNTSTLFATNMFYAAGYKQTNAASGTYSYSSKVDTYDLNQNGSTTDKIGGIDPDDTTSCQITAHSATLDVAGNITVTNEGIISSESDNHNILSSDDIITYNLDIGCSNGGQVDNFKYFIPIPNLTNVRDDFLIAGSVEDSFDIYLTGEAILSGTDIYIIEYTFDTGLSYETVSEIENWYSAEYIKTNNLNFEDVTMIRLTSSSGLINNGDSSRISINLKYKGNTYNEEAGKEIVWSSGGYFNYVNNGREVAGNFSTPSVTVKLTYELILSDIVLTASKDMLPQIEGNVNELYVTDEIPSFIREQNFKIKEVETYNVKLQTREYIKSNVDMSGINANQTFGVTVKLNDSSEYDIIPGVQTDIGANTENTVPKIKFKLYNADSLSDNIQSRYIIVTLDSDNGVTLKQKIIINREITKASEVSPSIVAGNNYSMLSEISSNLYITQDSSFTAQFATEYIGNLYSDQKMVFSSVLPVGTRITLVSTRGSSNPTYWYYIVADLNLKEISLSSFMQMGKTTGSNYTYLESADNIKEQFLVVVDFSQNNSYLSAGNYSIKLTFDGIDVDDFSSTSLGFSIEEKRTFEITSSVSEVDVNTEFELSYNLSDISAEESGYVGKKLSLVINCLKLLPMDSYILLNDTNKYYLNNDNEFIIPLSDVQNGSGSTKLKLVSNMLSVEEEKYVMNTELWVSSTANAILPKFGTLVAQTEITLVNPKVSSPSLKIIGMDERIIKDTYGEKVLSYQYDGDSYCRTKVELYQKVGSGYQKLTNALNQVNGSTTHNMGTFDIASVNGKNDITFMLSSLLQEGTYRLVLKVFSSNEEQLIEVPYNFLIDN